MRYPFTKYHGLGNDFVLLDAIHNPLAMTDDRLRAAAMQLCDRHTGIGADGILLIEGRPGSPSMRIINADGSFASMCGNGIRCIARHLVEHHGASDSMTIATPAGTVDVNVHLQNGAFLAATVNMGRPILTPERIAVRDVTDALRFPMPRVHSDEAWHRAAGVVAEASAVSMGNPHLIVRCTDLEAIPLALAGPQLEHHPMFPDRTNVHFVRLESQSRVRAITWERGAGPTQACGSGACAISVAFTSLGLTGRHVTVSLPGGDLDIHWTEDDHVLMRGPATFVFSGLIDL